MRKSLKKLWDWYWPSAPKPSPLSVSTTFLADLEKIMPGKALTIELYSGRQFTIVEREEFELIIERGGYRMKDKTP